MQPPTPSCGERETLAIAYGRWFPVGAFGSLSLHTMSLEIFQPSVLSLFHNDDDDEFYLSMRSAFISMAITFVITAASHQQVFFFRSRIAAV